MSVQWLFDAKTLFFIFVVEYFLRTLSTCSEHRNNKQIGAQATANDVNFSTCVHFPQPLEIRERRRQQEHLHFDLRYSFQPCSRIRKVIWKEGDKKKKSVPLALCKHTSRAPHDCLLFVIGKSWTVTAMCLSLYQEFLVLCRVVKQAKR